MVAGKTRLLVATTRVPWRDLQILWRWDIILISAVGGRGASPGLAAYQAAKWAVVAIVSPVDG